MEMEKKPIDYSTYFKEYYQKNKDKWRKQQEKTYTCELCNKTLKLCKKARHNRTNMHRRLEEQSKKIKEAIQEAFLKV